MRTTNTPIEGTATRTVRLPSAAVTVGFVYAMCTLAPVAFFVGQILFTDVDPHKHQGPIESIVSVGLVGTLALVLGVGMGLWFAARAQRARVGALVLAALAIITIPAFWSGAPGIFGACAAWLGGLTRSSSPQTGAARYAGILGAFIALLDVVLTLGGFAITALLS